LEVLLVNGRHVICCGSCPQVAIDVPCRMFSADTARIGLS
jgi:hypothetical protein